MRETAHSVSSSSSPFLLLCLLTGAARAGCAHTHTHTLGPFVHKAIVTVICSRGASPTGDASPFTPKVYQLLFAALYHFLAANLRTLFVGVVKFNCSASLSRHHRRHRRRPALCKHKRVSCITLQQHRCSLANYAPFLASILCCIAPSLTVANYQSITDQ